MLLQADNAVATLDKEMTPGAQTVINNNRISLHQLDEARAMLVAESRAGLSLVKRAVLSYCEDPMHLTNIPATLQSTSGEPIAQKHSNLYYLAQNALLAPSHLVASDYLTSSLLWQNPPLLTRHAHYRRASNSAPSDCSWYCAEWRLCLKEYWPSIFLWVQPLPAVAYPNTIFRI